MKCQAARAPGGRVQWPHVDPDRVWSRLGVRELFTFVGEIEFAI